MCRQHCLQWRGKQFPPWHGNEIENIGHVIGAAAFMALLFFLAGGFKDRFLSRSGVRSKIDPATVETARQSGSERRTAQRYNNFVARNWRGEYPLFVSYWVFGLIGNFAIGLVPLGLAAVYESKSGFEPLSVFGFILAVWLLTVGIAVWQWVSVWRWADRYIERKSLKLERAPWAGVAKLMAVIAFLQLGYAVVWSAVPQVTEASRVAFMNDPQIPPYFIRVMRNGTEAEITGGIKYGLTDDLKKFCRHRVKSGLFISTASVAGSGRGRNYTSSSGKRS